MLWSVVVSGKLVHAFNIVVNDLQKFQMDVVVDLVCYQRHGHNEQVRLPVSAIFHISIFGASKPTLKTDILACCSVIRSLVSSLQPLIFLIRESMCVPG